MPRAPHFRPGLASLALISCALGVFAGCGDSTGSAPQPGLVPQPGSQAPPRPGNLDAFDPALIEAVEATLAQIEAAPSDLDSWWRLGKLYEAHVLLEFAGEAYQRVTELSPKDPKAWYRLALMKSREGQQEPALEAFAQVHRLAPDYAPAWRKRGRFLLDMGRMDEAREAFEATLARQPQDASASLGLVAIQLDEGDADGALASLEALGQLGPGDAPLGHRLRGLALARVGREDEAEAELALGQGARPGGSDPWSRNLLDYKVGESAVLLRTERLLNKGQVTAALKLLEPLRQAGSDDARIWRRLGKAYTILKRHGDAASSLLRASELEPDFAGGWLATAVAQQAAGQAAAAARSAQRVLALEPKRSEAAVLRAELLLGLGQAEQVLELMSTRPATEASADLQVLAGKAAIELGQHADALQSFQRASELDPAYADAWAGRALAQLGLGSKEPAAAAIEQLAELDPEHPLLAPLRAGLAQEPSTPSPSDGR